MIFEGSVGAFFDIDNTLLPAPSLEWRFVEWLLASDLLERKQILEWARQGLFAFWSEGLKGIARSKGYLAGLSTQVVQNWEASLAAGALAPFPAAAERLEQHLACNHRIFLISGSLAPLANVLGRQFGASIEVHATKIERVGEIYSGRIEGRHASGSEKASAVQAIANRDAIDLEKSYAYGDSLDDLAMLECLGNPVVVNPCRKLKRIATSRRWRVLEWKAIELREFDPERHFSMTENGR